MNETAHDRPVASYPHIAQRLFSCPLMISRVKLEAILAAIGPRLGLVAGEAIAAPSGQERRDRSRLQVSPEGIATVSITGTLVRRTSGMSAYSGMTSYSEISEDVMDAATDPAVRGILLDIDSPGGEAGGLPDLMDALSQAAELKALWAVANDEAFSAAYGIASCAHEIWLSRTGGVGSVGVIAVHLDHSQADQAAGLHYTVFRGGRYKAEHNSFEPLTEHANSTLQAEVDRLHRMFADQVAANRGISFQEILATEAELYFGEGALAAGFADHVGTFEQAHAALADRLDDGQSPKTMAIAPAPSTQEEVSMSDDHQETREAPVPKPTVTEPVPETTNVIDLEQARSEAEASGRQQALAYAREVRELCRLAGQPERADEFLEKEASVENVRTALLEARASEDEAVDIASGHDPDAPALPKVDLAEVSTDAYSRLCTAAVGS